MNRNQRLSAIQRIIREEEIENQAALVRALREAGFEVTQSTISRDLRDLGLHRVRGGNGKMVYAWSDVGPSHGPSDFKRVLREFLLDAIPSGNIMVLRTGPGNAQPLAAAIDRANLPDILGTLAGDDTIMAVLAPYSDGERLAGRLKEMAGFGRVARAAEVR